jgi:hypothetical protein
LRKQKVLLKIAHSSKEIVRAVEIIFAAANSTNSSLILTPSHHVFVMRNGIKTQIPSHDVNEVTDQLFWIQNDGQVELVNVLEVKHIEVPANELVWVGTDT